MRRHDIGAIDDKRLQAILDCVVPLSFDGGGSTADDRPAHVRSASAVRQWGSRMVIVQDDVNVLALRDDSGGNQPLLLPVGPGGRRMFDDELGNKRHKMDLEACAVLPDGRLIAFGSGSSPARETLVLLRAGAPPRLVTARGLYAHLRSTRTFAGSELNVEGAVVKGEKLLLLQRGNGAEQDGVGPVNAIGTLDVGELVDWLDEGGPVPRLSDVTRLALGSMDGVPLGITDATVTADGRVAVIACAEDSPDVLRDGRVVGCRFGYLEERVLRMTDVLTGAGDRAGLKLEGIEGRPGAAGEFDVVADMDRPWEPAQIGRLRVREG